MEKLTIRHRNRLRHHYTQTSNVLLFGYQNVSDGAKLTYQVIDSFDWSNAAGKRKGFAHPSLRRLAEIRRMKKRSVRRHLVELEGASLITRQERRGRPSLLVIEDPSPEEIEQYLRTVSGPGEDKIVLPTPDKNVRPYKKDEETKERQNLVNEEQASSELEKERRRDTTPMPKAKREYLANEMLAVLQDEHSLGYYRRLAETIEPQVISEALSIVKQMAREHRILKSAGAAFAAIIKQKLSQKYEASL